MFFDFPPTNVSSASTGPANFPPVSMDHASRMRCSMNQAVFCETPRSRWSFMLDTLLRLVRQR